MRTAVQCGSVQRDSREIRCRLLQQVDAESEFDELICVDPNLFVVELADKTARLAPPPPPFPLPPSPKSTQTRYLHAIDASFRIVSQMPVKNEVTIFPLLHSFRSFPLPSPLSG